MPVSTGYLVGDRLLFAASHGCPVSTTDQGANSCQARARYQHIEPTQPCLSHRAVQVGMNVACKAGCIARVGATRLAVR